MNHIELLEAKVKSTRLELIEVLSGDLFNAERNYKRMKLEATLKALKNKIKKLKEVK